MQTSRLISTISFNSETFLEGTLLRLVNSGVLEYAHWIRHKAEEQDKKDHWHVIVQPNKRIDTNALRKQFTEFATGSASAQGETVTSDSLVGGRALGTLPGVCKPLGTLIWQNTCRMRDWLLYAVHDRLFLLSKGETKKIEYTFDDLRTTFPEQLENDWLNAHTSDDSKLRLILAAIEEGTPFQQLVSQGVIPIGQYLQYRRLYLDMVGGGLNEQKYF